MLRSAFLALIMVGIVSAAAVASPTIIGGTWDLQPAPGQVIQILVTGEPGDPIFDPSTFEHLGGGDAFSGANLQMTVSDGSAGPVITGVDLIGVGTLFNGNNTGQGTNIDTPRQSSTYTTTSSGYVGPNGVLAFVTFDATGLAPGSSFVLDLSIPELFQTSDLPPFAPVGFGVNSASDVIVQNGTLNIVPEPSSVVMGLFAAAGLGAVLIRRRRNRQVA